MSAFLKLDVFRKLPKDLTEPTTCGGIGKYEVHFFEPLSFSVHPLRFRPRFPLC